MIDECGPTLSLQAAQALVGPGWAALIQEAWEAVQSAGGSIRDAKEKFGRLVISYSLPPAGSNERSVARQIGRIVERSQRTCEICAQPGRIREIEGWHTCVCEPHAQRMLRGEGFHALCLEEIEQR